MPSRYSLPKWPTLNLERELGGRVCGVDEAGYAPLAGPVVAAAVVLPPGPKPKSLRGLTDSKLLRAGKREHFFALIHAIADVGVGMATVEEIDRLNIFHADMLAMRRAVESLHRPPDSALVDGRGAPPLACAVKTVIKGDRRSLSVAAASVVAKVVRDRLMQALAARLPGYGWHTNVGYGTDEHYLGLLRKGPTRHHRRSFAPLTTLFASKATSASNAPSTATYRFEPVRTRPDLGRVSLLELRQDLRAVFDGKGFHLGQVKNLRGRWTFQAAGYDEDNEPVAGAGPCARCHGRSLPGPDVRALQALLSA
jgi:ribonuclease HII